MIKRVFFASVFLMSTSAFCGSNPAQPPNRAQLKAHLFDTLQRLAVSNLVYFDRVSAALLTNGYFTNEDGSIYTEDFTCMELPRLRNNELPINNREQVRAAFARIYQGEWENLFWELVEDRYRATQARRNYYAAKIRERLTGSVEEDFMALPDRIFMLWESEPKALASYRTDMNKKFQNFIAPRKKATNLPVDAAVPDEAFEERLNRLSSAGASIQANCQPSQFHVGKDSFLPTKI